VHERHDQPGALHRTYLVGLAVRLSCQTALQARHTQVDGLHRAVQGEARVLTSIRRELLSALPSKAKDAGAPL